MLMGQMPCHEYVLHNWNDATWKRKQSYEQYSVCSDPIGVHDLLEKEKSFRARNDKPRKLNRGRIKKSSSCVIQSQRQNVTNRTAKAECRGTAFELHGVGWAI
ncbi:hypothetical protein PILCRDRAFT_816564, partial [Piloderma croceum F 1598]